MKIYKRQINYNTGLFGTAKKAIQVDKDGVIRTVNHTQRISSKITQISDEREETKQHLKTLLGISDRCL